MTSVKTIISNYESDNFGIEVATKNKSVTIKSFWGNLNQYQSFIKDLLKEGYTVFE